MRLEIRQEGERRGNRHAQPAKNRHRLANGAAAKLRAGNGQRGGMGKDPAGATLPLS